MDLAKKKEIDILKDNVRELQSQLRDAHQRIGELVSEKSTSNEEVIQQKQFIQELTGQLNRVNKETEIKIQQVMDEIPDVLDSSKTFLKE
jgi:predicted  nucleic acid-binding Zn-ribbon protein